MFRVECNKCGMVLEDEDFMVIYIKLNELWGSFTGVTDKCIKCRGVYTFRLTKDNIDVLVKDHYDINYPLPKRNIKPSAHMRRRVREYIAEGSHTKEELYNKWETVFNKLCCYCGKELSKDRIIGDHYIPLCYGGNNNIDNIMPCCSKCNLKKGTKCSYNIIGPKEANTINKEVYIRE